GGMGEVWLADDAQLPRKVAVKLLPAEFTADSDRVRRFAQEARAASALNHPNIITIHEIGEIEESHFIVTEYVEGKTLRQQMADAPDSRINLAEAIDLTIQIAAALAAAHEAGIVHRDIKPENVMVRRDGIVKVLDFGLAKLTESRNADFALRIEEAETLAQHTPNDPQSTSPGARIGTPRYMSPEQARGEEVDARTDIFSLGVMLFEMVAGRAPFTGKTTSEVIEAIKRDSPPPLAECAPDAPSELARIIGKALHKDCGQRYQTAKELQLDLKNLTEERAFKARLESSASTLSAGHPASQIKTHKKNIAIALAGLIIAIAAIAYYYLTKPGYNSLAILPFVNAGGNANDEYLSDGVTETLINNLSQLPHLKVIPRSSVFRYKGREVDTQAAGRELGVHAVLKGSVTERGDSLHIDAELVDVESKGRIWGKQYNVKPADIFAVQEEIARQVSEGLRVKTTSKDKQRLVNQGTKNAEAYRLYCLGRFFWNKFG
ncbi:MAG: serine/threonine-protein kinase, partial [Acidobacteriota bacterium]